jgi:uncharacterized membrane protein
MRKAGSRLRLSAIGRIFARPEWVFAVLALAGGLAMLILTGPFQAPDEFAHFDRAYQITDGKMLPVRSKGAVGGWLPEDLLAAEAPFISLPFHPERKVDRETLTRLLAQPCNQSKPRFAAFPNTALYVPLAYLPQAIGIAIGRAFGTSALAMLYIGRLFGLLAWTGCLWVAIRVIPILKWTVVLFALMPIHLFIAGSVTADTVVNATAILFAALLVSTLSDEFPSVRTGTLPALAVLCVFLATAKSAYAPLTALILLIPANKFGTVKAKLLFCGTVLGMSLAAAVLWDLEVARFHVPLNGSDAGAQISFILHHPLRYSQILFHSAWLYSLLVFFQRSLGWLDTPIPAWIIATYPLALIASLFLDRRENTVLAVWQKLYLLLVIMFIYLIILTALYVTWTKPYATFIEGKIGRAHEGMQVRYLIPLGLPFLLFLYIPGARPKHLTPPLIGIPVCAYSAAVLVFSCLALHARYHG